MNHQRKTTKRVIKIKNQKSKTRKPQKITLSFSLCFYKSLKNRVRKRKGNLQFIEDEDEDDDDDGQQKQQQKISACLERWRKGGKYGQPGKRQCM